MEYRDEEEEEIATTVLSTTTTAPKVKAATPERMRVRSADESDVTGTVGIGAKAVSAVASTTNPSSRRFLEVRRSWERIHTSRNQAEHERPCCCGRGRPKPC